MHFHVFVHLTQQSQLNRKAHAPFHTWDMSLLGNCFHTSGQKSFQAQARYRCWYRHRSPVCDHCNLAETETAIWQSHESLTHSAAKSSSLGPGSSWALFWYVRWPVVILLCMAGVTCCPHQLARGHQNGHALYRISTHEHILCYFPCPTGEAQPKGITGCRQPEATKPATFDGNAGA